MPKSVSKIPVYLEIGKSRTFAGAIDWPGWCRSGRDEGAALDALYSYWPRYVRVLRGTPLASQMPDQVSSLAVIERLAGNSSTDFGAPDISPSSDKRPVSDADLARFQVLLKACWRTFDQAVNAAKGKELSKGPRGGGRVTESIVEHILGADAAYLGMISWKLEKSQTRDLRAALKLTRQAMLKALIASAHGELPTRGPRGGLRWTTRYFVRRVTWHVLDHAWEIQDRIT